MKKCSTSLASRETHTQTRMRDHLTEMAIAQKQKIINAGENMREKQLLYTLLEEMEIKKLF